MLPAAAFAQRSPAAGVLVVAAAGSVFVRLQFGMANVTQHSGFTPEGVAELIAQHLDPMRQRFVCVHVQCRVMFGDFGVSEERFCTPHNRALHRRCARDRVQSSSPFHRALTSEFQEARTKLQAALFCVHSTAGWGVPRRVRPETIRLPMCRDSSVN